MVEAVGQGAKQICRRHQILRDDARLAVSEPRTRERSAARRVVIISVRLSLVASGMSIVMLKLRCVSQKVGLCT